MNTSHSSAKLHLWGREQSWAPLLPCDPQERASVTPLEYRGVHRTAAANHENRLQHLSQTCCLSASCTERSQSVGPQPSAQRWRLRVNRPAAGNSSTTVLIRATRTLSRRQSMLQHSFRSLQAQRGAAWPNPSFKRSANGRPPGPRSSAGVHYLQRGPGALPSSPA